MPGPMTTVDREEATTAANSLMRDATDAAIYSRNSGIEDVGIEAENAAVKRVGTEIVTYEGEYQKVRPRGGEGSMYSPQTIDVIPASRGNGVLEKIPGWGSTKAQGSTLKVSRVSKNSIDTKQKFKARRPTMQTFAITGANPVQVEGLIINVPIAAGVTTLLEADGCIEMKGEAATTALQARIVIGTDNTTLGGAGLSLDESGALGDPFHTGGDTNYHQPYLEHSRLLLGTEADEESGVPCFITVQKFSGGSGAPPPKSAAKFLLGDTWRCTANDVNVRDAPNGGIVTQIDAGVTGTIVAPGTPVRAGEYIWWPVSGGGSRWIAENFITNITVRPPVDPASTLVRSGWLRVWRYPQ